MNDFEIKLGIAREFDKIGKFYLPVNTDFRGRVYPLSPHLNFMGDDIARGLLEFGVGKNLAQED